MHVHGSLLSHLLLFEYCICIKVCSDLWDIDVDVEVDDVDASINVNVNVNDNDNVIVNVNIIVNVNVFDIVQSFLACRPDDQSCALKDKHGL